MPNNSFKPTLLRGRSGVVRSRYHAATATTHRGLTQALGFKMNFKNRIKKELTEAVVRSILVDAGYRVLDFGIESQIRELECLSALEYLGLDLPSALRCMPDLLVMNREQTVRHLVEVKFRSGWSVEVIESIEQQVKIFQELTLIYFNTKPSLPNGKTPSPSTYLRFCNLKVSDGLYMVEVVDHKDKIWIPCASLKQAEGQWWGLRPVQEVFEKVDGRKDEATLGTAIESLKGLIEL